MADISISLNNIQDIKTVNIEGLGLLNVRKLGSGEELDLSSRWRRARDIYEELAKMDFTKFDVKKSNDLKKIESLAKKSEKLNDELTEIQQFEFDTYKNLLSDDKNGEVVKVIMDTLTDKQRGELFKQIFEIKAMTSVDKTSNNEEEINE